MKQILLIAVAFILAGCSDAQMTHVNQFIAKHGGSPPIINGRFATSLAHVKCYSGGGWVVYRGLASGKVKLLAAMTWQFTDAVTHKEVRVSGGTCVIQMFPAAKQAPHASGAGMKLNLG